MKRTLRFFKQDGKWYADVPNHTLEENEMVMGSESAIEYFADGKDEIQVTMSTDESDKDGSLIQLKIYDHDDEGAYYTVSGLLVSELLVESNYISLDGFSPTVWVCNVTHDVFGEHPDNIYIMDAE